MPIAPANGISLCYDTVGSPEHPALLLVMGFTAQLTGWDDRFCRMLADGGRYVIRFDNRDCGLSTHFDGVTVDLPGVLAAWESDGVMPPIPYSMSDFSNDAFALLDHLGIEKAHIVGASMGDMIDVRVSTRSGCSTAMVWTIMPPIDAPTMWAFSIPR